MGDHGGSIGEQMRSHRARRGLTQARLAEAVPCAVITIRKIEAEERRPSPAMAERVAEVLGLIGRDRADFLAAAGGVTVDARFGSAATWLPHPVHPVLGRQGVLSDVASLLSGPSPARLVTLTGPPGVGKTRLALEIAHREDALGRHRVVWAELAVARDTADVETVLSQVADLGDGVGGDRMQRLNAWLGATPTLLVLDNLEQLGAEVTVVAALLAASAGLSCLATSRGRLDLYGEHEVPVRPLDVPAEWPAGAGLGESPAVQLFVDRVRAAAPGSAQRLDLGEVADLCRRLDGLPLAIELAARAMRERPLGELRTALDRGLGALGTGTRDRDPRHRTMTDAVEWSYALLGAPAQRMMRALSVARRPVDLDYAAELSGDARVVADGALHELVDQGLARRTDDGVVLFEVVRAVGVARLVAHGDETVVRRRHARRAAATADRVTELLANGEEHDALRVLGDATLDLRAAMAWSFDHGEPSLGCRILSSAMTAWQFTAPWPDAQVWLERARALAVDPDDRAAAILGCGMVAWLRGDHEAATATLDEAVEVAHDHWVLAEALGLRGMVDLTSGRPAAAVEALEQARDHQVLAGNEFGLAFADMRLGRVRGLLGDLDAWIAGNAAARGRFEAIGSDWGVASAIGNDGEIAVAAGRPGAAIEPLLDAIARFRVIPADQYAASRLTTLAAALVALGRHERAVQVCGISDAWLGDVGVPLLPFLSFRDVVTRQTAREALAGRFDDLLAAGRSLPRDDSSLRALTAG